MYDLIGDIHGHADELVQLLQMLGYTAHQGIYRHPDRKVIFLGDFIDRGPKIRQTLDIVRPMVEAGQALAVMGNHEFNALAYHTEDVESAGEFLRRRHPANVRQHAETVRQLTPGDLESHLNWFRQLPMWLKLGGLRAVHACWDDREIAKIAQELSDQKGVSTDFLQMACRPGNPLFASIETVLKGKEAALPNGIMFHDKDGHIRNATRVKWYLPAEQRTYRDYSLTDEIHCDVPVEQSVVEAAAPYPATARPVFCGHYWMTASRPGLLAHNVACLDYSVARGGFLCAYRWNGEQTLSNENFVWTTQVNAEHHHAKSAEALQRNH